MHRFTCRDHLILLCTNYQPAIYEINDNTRSNKLLQLIVLVFWIMLTPAYCYREPHTNAFLVRRPHCKNSVNAVGFTTALLTVHVSMAVRFKKWQKKRGKMRKTMIIFIPLKRPIQPDCAVAVRRQRGYWGSNPQKKCQKMRVTYNFSSNL